jgi:8-amino-7-oxononanoate synthase
VDTYNTLAGSVLSEKEISDMWGFKRFVKNAVDEGFFYDLLTTTKPVGPTICYKNREMINFASINILDLHNEQDVLQHFYAACGTYGLTTGGSRVTQGVCQAHADMEQELCRFTGKERALSFASGLLANIGFVNAMTSKFNFSPTCNINNSDTIFVMDRDCHWSLWKAASHLEFGEQLFAFKHNNVKDLNRVLAKIHKSHKKVIVVFESVYSADGSVAPMEGILDTCEKYNALSFVDDANGFLIYGPENRLFAKEFAAMKRATFVMVSFSKAVGLEGGAIAGPKEYIHGFEVLSGTSLFTAAIQPPTASTIQYIMLKLKAHPEIMDHYLVRSLKLRQDLEDRGFVLNDTPSYIISVMIGNDEKAVRVYDEFLQAGFIVPMFRYPAVKPDHALIRIMINAHHTEEQLDKLVSVLERLKAKYEF